MPDSSVHHSGNVVYLKILLILSFQSFFAERFFHLFDKDGSGSISLRELMDGLTLLTNGSEIDKLHFLFQVYDVDGNYLSSLLFKQNFFSLT